MTEDTTSPEIPEWWAPGDPGHRAHGYLDVGPDGATVTLVDRVGGILAGDYNQPVLLGETDKEPLTLLHPTVTASGHKMTPERAWFTATFVSDSLLRGIHVEDLDTAKFDHAAVRLAGLRDICLHPVSNAQGEDVTYVTPGIGARFVKLPGRGHLVFRQWQEKTEAPYREMKEVGVEVEIHPNEPLTLGDFDSDWLRPLEAFTILGARGPTSLQRFMLTKVGAGEPDQEATVESREPALAAKPLDKYKPLIPLAALGDGDEAAKVIGRWWKLYHNLGPSAGFLHAALSGEMYLEQKLLQAASFTEAYHRDIHGSGRRRLTLRHRLEALIERAHETVPNAPGLDSALARSLADTRNSLAHLNRGLRSGKALEHIDLVYGVAQLRLIIQINLLLDLKVKKTLVRELVWWSYDRGRQVPMTDYRN
jgi:hypothetical protein